VKLTILGLPEKEYLYSGFNSCPGCGEFLALRYCLKALGDKAIVVLPAGCITSVFGLFPRSSFRISVLNMAFEAAAAGVSGVTAALRAKGVKDIIVAAFAGDGGTADIGIQALSGAAERQDDIIYICFDNEAYMNTGIQRSSTTPFGASTTTTPIIGKLQHKKDMPLIMAAHKVPYVATSCSSYPQDIFHKVRKAYEMKGATRYIHILCPCSPGWGFDANMTVEVGRLAVITGMWPLYEIENGKFILSGPSRELIYPSKRVPIKEYLKLQGRFRHLTNEQIQAIQAHVNTQWENINRMLGE
jgi:pyruvate ferredoxin oxidoreductase beta subunit